MSMPAMRRRWTTAEVRALTDENRAWPRYELIAGELLVTPAPGYAHQLVAADIYSLLNAYVDSNSSGITVMSPSDLELKKGTITQPDVFVIPAASLPAAEPGQWSDVKSLLLAVEVLSPSSLRTDRVKKREFYLANHVEEYWIVDVEARRLERWKPGQKNPEVIRDALAWSPRGRAPLVIALPALFDRVDAKLRLIGQ